MRPTLKPLLNAAWLFAVLAPTLAFAQASPFLTGATSLQTNILAWLTPIAIILVMVLGGLAMANRIAQVSSTYGDGAAHTIVENCSNTLILRCAASEGGGTARFASQLIGEREVLRSTESKSRRVTELFGSITRSQQLSLESSVLASQIEQLPDLSGFLKYASDPTWLRVQLNARQAWAQQRTLAHPTAPRSAARGVADD